MRSFWKLLLFVALALFSLDISYARKRVHAPRAVISDSQVLAVGADEDVMATRGGNAGIDLPKALSGSLVMALIERVVKIGLKKADVDFPAMLAGCIALFFSLIALEGISPSAAKACFEFLTPASAFLAKWMSPLFVPGLVLLPLSPSVGGSVEILKIIAVVVVGFLFTLTSSTFSVVAVRSAMGSLKSTSGEGAGKKSAPAKPFNQESWRLFSMATLLSGAVCLYAVKTGNEYATPIQTLFLGFLTVAAYIWSANLPAAFVKFVHPLATSSALILLIIQGLAKVTDRPFMTVLKAYRTSSLAPMKAGSGDVLMFLLGPCVVGFAVSMYSRRALLFQNLPAVLTAAIVSSAGSLFATAGMVRAIALGVGPAAKLLRLSVLSRNVTTALALALTSMVGGDISIAASVVCLTGIIGGTYGVSILNALGVTDPISRGLGIGSAAQGLGVIAISGEPDAFPFAAIAMVLTAIAATSLTSIPGFRNALIQTATGSISAGLPPIPTP